MKMKLSVVWGVLLLASMCSAQDRPAQTHGKLRKTLAITACAASAFDMGTTAVAMNNPHLREGGLLASGSGKPMWMTLSLLKGASCGVGLYFAWHPRQGPLSTVSLYGSAASTAMLGYVGFHNWSLIRQEGGR